MHDRSILRLSGFVFLVMAFSPVARAHGDKVYPQVVDGKGTDGVSYRTRLDITNLGPDQATRITKVHVLFFRQNGTPWSVSTNLGNSSDFKLDLGAFQTIRLETQGTGALTVGYIVVRNLEGTTVYSEDFEVNVSAYYEISTPLGVVDTISVPEGKPTVAWVFPTETSISKGLLTGFAIVNLSSLTNNVTLKTFAATSPSSSTAPLSGEAKISLAPGEQTARYLYQSGLFPSLTEFKGMLLGYSDGPVSILALLQTPTSTGPQYTTLVPSYADSLRRNTYLYLRQGFPLDADIPVVDYYANADDTAPWDLLFETVNSTGGRRLAPQSGAAIAALGTRTDSQFDDEVTIEYLRGLNYTTDPIDMSNSSPNLVREFAFAVRTGLGRYVKVRIADVIDAPPEKDLALEIYIYK